MSSDELQATTETFVTTSETAESLLPPPKLVTEINERKAAIQYAMQVANELGADVSWRDLVPRDFFNASIVIQKLEGSLHLNNAFIESVSFTNEISGGVSQINQGQFGGEARIVNNTT